MDGDPRNPNSGDMLLLMISVRHLCDRAGIVCNKSDRDRAGWDFIVDFPLSEAGTDIFLDQRRKTRCNVQFKATAVPGNGMVALKHSATDLLAKDPPTGFHHPTSAAPRRRRATKQNDCLDHQFALRISSFLTLRDGSCFGAVA